MTYAAMARCDEASRGRNHFSFALISSAALCAVAVASGISLMHLRSTTAPAPAPVVKSADASFPVVVHTWAVERPSASALKVEAAVPDAAALAAAAKSLSSLARSKPMPPAPIATPARQQVASLDPKAEVLQSSPVARVATAEADAVRGIARPDGARIVPTVPPTEPAAAEIVPIPKPKPAFLAPPKEDAEAAPPVRDREETPRRSRRRLAREVPGNPAVAAQEPDDKRNILEKLFGGSQPTTNATAYAPSDGGLGGLFGRKPSAAAAFTPADGGLGRLFGGGKPSQDGQTAIYDISAHTVYLPDGRRLEAHSGLGSLLDNPNGIHTPNRGATPPNTYQLSVRESLFHGVRALRLSPVGGGTTFGRNGLLAHTFMLGPRGDSNGCVVFRDYDAFLQAFDSGAIRRLQVVTSMR